MKTYQFHARLRNHRETVVGLTLSHVEVSASKELHLFSCYTPVEPSWSKHYTESMMENTCNRQHPPVEFLGHVIKHGVHGTIWVSRRKDYLHTWERSLLGIKPEQKNENKIPNCCVIHAFYFHFFKVEPYALEVDLQLQTWMFPTLGQLVREINTVRCMSSNLLYWKVNEIFFKIFLTCSVIWKKPA